MIKQTASEALDEGRQADFSRTWDETLASRDDFYHAMTDLLADYCPKGDFCYNEAKHAKAAKLIDALRELCRMRESKAMTPI